MAKIYIEVALERNKSRTKDKAIPNKTIKSVYSQLQAPSIDEGFSDILIINHSVI